MKVTPIEYTQDDFKDCEYDENSTAYKQIRCIFHLTEMIQDSRDWYLMQPSNYRYKEYQDDLKTYSEQIEMIKSSEEKLSQFYDEMFEERNEK